MPKSPLSIKNYKCDTNRIINRYYQNRINDIREDYAINKPRRSRINNISPFMMSIVSLIHYLEEDAKKIGLVFDKDWYGVSGNDLIEWFNQYTNKETISENLYRLYRIRMLIRIQFDKEFYYRVNDQDFICKNGVYLFKYGKINSINNLFFGYCDICHYCNYKADKCTFHHIFSKKMQSITSLSAKKVEESDIYKNLKNRIDWNKNQFMNLSSYKSKLSKLGFPSDKMTELEIYYYYDLVDKKIKNKENKDELIIYFRKMIRKKKIKQKSINEKNENYLKVVKKIEDQNKTKIIVDEWGFNPLMISILNIINIGREDAKLMNIQFPGFSMYHIEQLLNGLWISNETIYDNLYKINRMNLIKKIYYDDDEKPQKSKNEFYFDLNDDRFLCVGGMYLFYYPYANNKYKIFNGVCPNHHFCPDPKCSSNCTIIKSIKNIRQMFFYQNSESKLELYLKSKLKSWGKDFLNYEIYKENFEKIINYNIKYVNFEILRRSKEKRVESVPYLNTNKILDHLTDIEILYYGKNLTIYYYDDREFRKLIDGICETIALSITRKIKKDRKGLPKKKKKEIDYNMNYKQLIEAIILGSKKKKIRLF